MIDIDIRDRDRQPKRLANAQEIEVFCSLLRSHPPRLDAESTFTFTEVAESVLVSLHNGREPLRETVKG